MYGVISTYVQQLWLRKKEKVHGGNQSLNKLWVTSNKSTKITNKFSQRSQCA